MSNSQWTVTGLLILLVGLEVVRSPNVKGFFTGIFSNFNTALGGAGATTPVTGKEAPAPPTGKTTTPGKANPSIWPAPGTTVYGV